MDSATFADILHQAQPGQQLDLTVTGGSMQPFLLHGRSVVRLEVGRTPSVGDIVLFRRIGGELILHRIIRAPRSDQWTLCGDAQTWTEIIGRDQVLATVVGIRRQTRYRTTGHPGYRLLAWLWRILRPLRPQLCSLAGRIRRFFPKA